MSTSWNSQVAKSDYRIQFETDDYEKYKIIEKACCAVIDCGSDTDDKLDVINCGTDTDDKLKEHPFALQMVLQKIEFEIEEYIRMLSVLNASENVHGQSIAAKTILEEIRKTRYEWTKGEKMEKDEIYNPGEEIRIIVHRERDPITVGWKAEKNGDLYGDYVKLDRPATEHDIAAAAAALIEQALITLRIVPDMERKEG